MSALGLFIFHVTGVMIFTFGCYYDWNYVIIPKEATNMFGDYAWKLKFLTYWDALIQSLFYIICVLNDVIGSNKAQKNKDQHIITKIKNLFMSCIAFPLAMFVGLTFWALYAIDRELVFPKSIDPFFPMWLNHVMHTNIMIFILIEMYVTFRMYPTRKQGLTVLTSFMVCYLIWMHIVYYKTGVWVYPVMEVLDLPLRLCFFIALLGLSTVLYISGEVLNGKLWAKQINALGSRKEK